MSRRRRLLVGLLVVLLWLGMVVGGSHALLNDSAYLTNNSLITGSVGLTISSSQAADPALSTFNKTQSGFSLGQINPGEYTDRYFSLRNSSPGNFIFTIDMRSVVVLGSQDMAQSVYVEMVPVDISGNPIASSGATGTLYEMASSPLPLTGVELPRGAMQRFRMRVRVAVSYTKIDDPISFDLVLTGTQKI